MKERARRAPAAGFSVSGASRRRARARARARARKPPLGRLARFGRKAVSERASEVEDKDEKMKGIPPSATASAVRLGALLLPPSLRCCFSRWLVVSGHQHLNLKSVSASLGCSRSRSYPLTLLSRSFAPSCSVPRLCSTAARSRPFRSFGRAAPRRAASSLKVLHPGPVSLYLYSDLLRSLDTLETLHLSRTHIHVRRCAHAHPARSPFPSPPLSFSLFL